MCLFSAFIDVCLGCEGDNFRRQQGTVGVEEPDIGPVGLNRELVVPEAQVLADVQ